MGDSRLFSNYRKLIPFDGEFERNIDCMTDLILKDQSQTRTIMKQGFVGLGLQNMKLSEQNQDRHHKVEFLQEELSKVTGILEEKIEEGCGKGKRLHKKFISF